MMLTMNEWGETKPTNITRIKCNLAKLTCNWLTLGFWRTELYIVLRLYNPTYDWGGGSGYFMDTMEI